jgi:hypothetical protein
MNHRSLLSRFRAWTSSRTNANRPRPFRPMVERLEDRRLLSATTWTIDPSQSSLSLAIADQAVNYKGTDITIRVRNQSGGNSGPWNEGNSASLAGTFDTNYIDGDSIEFLAGQSNIVGIHSGDYRPNPNDFDPNATDAENPNGSFTGTSPAPAVFGGRVRASLVFIWETTVDAGFFSFRNTNYDVSSGVLPITSNRFASNSLTVAIDSSGLGIDGLSVIGIGQPVPDTLTTIHDMTATNSGPTATITDLGGPNRRLTIPFAFDLSIPIDNDPAHDLHATATGQVVANAVVDLPVTNVWHNDANPWDVDGLNGVAPLDVLVLVNHINNHPGDTSLPAPPAAGPPYYDVNDDNQITALDVVAVTNYLNTDLSGEGEAGTNPLGAVAVSVSDSRESSGLASPVETGSGIADLSRWPQRLWDAMFRGQDAATDHRAAPSDDARNVFAVADTMAGAGHSADARFSAEISPTRAQAMPSLAQRKLRLLDENDDARRWSDEITYVLAAPVRAQTDWTEPLVVGAFPLPACQPRSGGREEPRSRGCPCAAV